MVEVVGQTFSMVLGQLSPAVFVVMGLALALAATRVIKNLFLDGLMDTGSYTPTWKDINFKVINVISKTEVIKFSFYVRYLKKVNRFLAFFLQLDKENYLKVGKQLYKRDFKQYTFTTDYIPFGKIKDKIHSPLCHIEDYSFIFQFHDSIHYALSNLEEFSKMLPEDKLEDEIMTIIDYIQQVKVFYDSISNAAAAQTEKLKDNALNEILDRHHLIMNELSMSVKLFNGNSIKPTINLKKD